jgi:hypothetical protein
MKMIAVPQPWAGAAVLGKVEVLNLSLATRHRGPVLIYARGRDERVARDKAAAEALANDLAQEQQALLGMVEITGCFRAGDCQLPFAIGPNVWTISDPEVFPDPVPYRRFKGLAYVQVHDDADLRRAMANRMAPHQWRQLFQERQPVQAEQVYPRRSDGWVGD